MDGAGGKGMGGEASWSTLMEGPVDRAFMEPHYAWGEGGVCVVC